LEGHRAGLVGQSAAQAIDQRRLARAVGADQSDALALRDSEIDAVERDEAAEALAETGHLQQVLGHGQVFFLRMRFSIRPRMPFGAMITKATSSTPTSSRFTADEILTVAHCCSVPSRSAPINGPAHDVVPPIIGMAIELTAYCSPNADAGSR